MIDLGLNADQEDRAKALHEQLIVIDMLTESSLPDGLFEDMHRGGLTCGSFTIGAGGLDHFSGGTVPLLRDWWSWDATVRDLALWKKLFAQPEHRLHPILCAKDIQAAKSEGQVGIMLNTQNSICAGTDLNNIDALYYQGLRVMQLTYNLQNFLGSGCLEDPNNNLSLLGIDAIGRMNDLGMVVDTGHTGEGTILHALEVSEKPISCSHAGLKTLSSVENPRVVSDNALKAIADRGGVFGLSAIPGMLTGTMRCTINDYLDHLEHAINVMGIEHVGLGTDFVAGVELPQIATSPDWQGKQVPTSLDVWPVCSGHEGLQNHADYGNITRALVARGYSDENITRLMGGNWLRLLKDTLG
jgi:membrane dipeptidase